MDGGSGRARQEVTAVAETWEPEASTDWRPAFLAALRVMGSVSAACRAAGISRQTAYSTRRTSESFAAAWDAVLDERLKAEAQEG